MQEVLADAQLYAGAKNVGVRLALHLNIETQRCDPSYALLAAEVTLDRSNVIKAINFLERHGWVVRTRSISSNNFTLIMRGGVDASNVSAPRGESRRHHPPVAPAPPRESRRHHPNNELNNELNNEGDIAPPPSNDLFVELAPPSPSATAAPTGVAFDAFWDAYPLHKGKLAARRAFDRALRHAPSADIIAGARRHAAERAGQDPKFTKHPVNWLNAGCWDDPTDDVRGNAQQRRSRRTSNGSASAVDERRRGIINFMEKHS